MTERIERLKERGDTLWEIHLQSGRVLLAEEEVVIQHRLLPGKEMEEDLIGALTDLNRIASGYGRALSYLSYRPRSKKEMRTYLISKGYEKEAEEIIARLEREGAMNDAEFARLWVRERIALKPRGAFLLRKELQEKGIPEELITEALTLLDEEQEMELAFRQGLKKMKTLREKDWDSASIKIANYLMRKGYAYSLIEKILLRLEEEWER